ncbi:hypothetical protein JOC95_003993 [Bacillus tianshenii]|uniref:Uncharacterized protein n=1 Tax=Sutcliffiella tianshenii TaxID=1463404 RepID=A0ABS2P567_9BACI|nr:hypothetical protein [Bacillus tianshenii]MBM7622083.1 hypothetical protein [Bacillus tianshenii]
MKKNTGCGCNGHHECPAGPACDKAKSRSTFCEAASFPGPSEVTNAVIADVLMETLVEADITLPTYASDIKHIRKNVHLTQCKALTDAANPNTVKLFVEGYVHKNIQYVEDCSGVVKDYSVNIPFRCYDRVTPLTTEVLYPFGSEFSNKNNTFERKEVSKNGMGADRCTTGSLTFEIYNEPIKCTLMASAVNQWDLLEGFDNWGRFNKITEKMDVYLVIKLTQKQQQGFVPPTGFPTGFGDDAAFGVQESVYDRFRRLTGQ